MTVERWLLICVSVLMLTGMRNPFLPPEDRCQIAELSTWRFQGMVSQARDPLASFRIARKNGGGLSQMTS